MKHFIFAIGAFIHLATPAHAQGNAPDSRRCSGMDPISVHYLQPIVEYADEILEGGSSSSSSSSSGVSDADLEKSFELGYFSHLANAKDAIAALSDTEIRVEAFQENIEEATVCFHIDLCILEDKMEEVRMELQTAFEDKDVRRMQDMRGLITFLNDRYRSLALGGQDPTYVDVSAKYLTVFSTESPLEACMREVGDKDYCDANFGIAEFQSDEICPFDTNYLPPTSAGYGCDMSVLAKYEEQGHEAIDAEIKAIKDFVEKRKKLSESLRALYPSYEEQNDGHKRLAGCQAEVKTDNAGNYYVDVQGDALYRQGIAASALRGPFTFSINNSKMLRLFFALRMNWGERRGLQDFLQFNEETQIGKLIDAVIRPELRRVFTEWNVSQGGREARGVAKAVDAIKQVNLSMQPLRNAVKELSRLARGQGAETGPRSFTRDFAWFLRRSCIFRPCKDQLDLVLQAVTEDKCFPYVSGNYLSANTYEDCEKKAKEGLDD